jgi:hypothetical protein
VIKKTTHRPRGPLCQSSALAVHRLLDTQAAATTHTSRSTWRQISQTLARLEQAGTEPAAVLADALASAEAQPGGVSLNSLAAQVQAADRRSLDPQLPAWLRTEQHVTDPQWQPYLAARSDLIRHRVAQLARAAVSERPAWTSHLGAVPSDPSEHETWLNHIAAIATYRDQYRVADDDPNHPLGPYPKAGASVTALTGSPRRPSWPSTAPVRRRIRAGADSPPTAPRSCQATPESTGADRCSADVPNSPARSTEAHLGPGTAPTPDPVGPPARAQPGQLRLTARQAAEPRSTSPAARHGPTQRRA